MKSLNEYLLSEAFPPAKDKPTGPPKPNPFQKKGGPPKPGAGGEQFPAKKNAAPGDVEEDDNAASLEDETLNPNDPNAQQDGAEVFMLQQQMAAEKEQAELEARRQQAEEEAAERQRIKKMRLAADQEVAAALEDQYNDQDDTVTFFPDIISFSSYKDDKQNGKEGEKEVASEDDDKNVDEDEDSKSVADDEETDGKDTDDDESADDVDADDDESSGDDEGIDLEDDEESDEDEPKDKKKLATKDKKKPGLVKESAGARYYVWDFENEDTVSTHDKLDAAIASASTYKARYGEQLGAILVKDKTNNKTVFRA